MEKPCSGSGAADSDTGKGFVRIAFHQNQVHIVDHLQVLPKGPLPLLDDGDTQPIVFRRTINRSISVVFPVTE